MRSTLIGLVALFGFLLPGTIGVTWLLAGSHFLPSYQLQGISYLVGVPVALVLTAVVAPTLINEARVLGRRGKRMEQLGTLACLPFAPLLFFFVQHLFWVGGLMWVLHAVSPKEPRIFVERVAHKGYERRCHSRIVLQGDSLLTPRRLCRVDPDFHRNVRVGDAVRFSGQASEFGFKIESYTTVGTPHRR
ncbi:MAG: hypothetical protein JJT88_04070 [Gammaproteobacteria bacterium]|nr:hypothetical protein [Gammaproteobacteria bacterium]